MLSSWFGFYVFYLLVAAIPPVILRVRGFGWSWRFVGLSLLVSWTGGGWFIMTYLAMLKKHPGLALYQERKKAAEPARLKKFLRLP